MGSAAFTPAATGLMPALLDRDDLQQANALQQTASAAAGIAGPAVAGVFVVTAGPGWAIIVNAATFFVSAALLLLLRLEQVPRPQRQHWIRDLHEGWLDFWWRQWSRAIVLGFSATNMMIAFYQVLGPVISKHDYGGAGAWAAISAAATARAVGGGLAAVKLHPRHRLRIAVPFSVLGALGPLALAGLLPVPLVAVAAAFGGAGAIIFESIWQASVQRHVPEDMLSRASSYDFFGSLIAFPAGLALAGPLAAIAGARPVLACTGSIEIVLVALMLAAPSVRALSNQPAPTADVAQNA